MNKKKIFCICTCVIWGFVLLSGFCGRHIKKELSFSKEENRTLQEKPAFSYNTFTDGTYETEYENYVNDQFPLRNSFIQFKTKLDYILRQKESQGVVRGKNDYLMELFLPYSKKLETQKRQAIEKFSKKYPKVKQYSMIIPTASNILNDKLPYGAVQKNQNAWINSYNNWAKQNNITTIDVRYLFQKNKSFTDLYYHTDHHWTTDAAYMAWKESLAPTLKVNTSMDYDKVCICNTFEGSLSYKSGYETNYRNDIYAYFPVKKDFHSIVDYIDDGKQTATFYDSKKLKSQNAYEVFFGGNHGLLRISTPIKGKRTLLVFKDSYANCMLPFLASDFSKIIVLDPRYYYEDIDDVMKSESITDILYLYNANTYFEDTSLTSLLAY